jgi:hypothetical protein
MHNDIYGLYEISRPREMQIIIGKACYFKRTIFSCEFVLTFILLAPFCHLVFSR